MKNTYTPMARQRQQGVAAIELAVVLPVLVLMLAFPLFLARYFWHYTVAQKAAHDATLFLSQLPQTEMIRQNNGLEIPAANLARQIANMELAELNPGGTFPEPWVDCEYRLNATRTTWRGCDGALVPISVKVSVVMRMADPLFTPFTSFFTGDDGLFLMAEVPMSYVGN